MAKAGAGLLFVVLLAGVAYTRLDDDDNEASSARSDEPIRWDELPGAPLAARAEMAATWAGDQFFIWGGTSAVGNPEEMDQVGVPALTDGAMFNPRSGSWEVLEEEAPHGRTAAGALWTGEEVVIWGGSSTSGLLTFENTAFVVNVTTGQWRESVPAPIPGRLRPFLIWTGDEVVVVGGSSEMLAGDRNVVAWSPARDEWRQIAQLPEGFDRITGAHWTGNEIVVWGGSDRRTPGMVVDAATGSTVRLPPMPRSGPEPVGSVSVLNSQSLFVAGVNQTPRGDRLVAATLALPDGRWEIDDSAEVPGLPFDEAIKPAAARLGDLMVVWGAWWPNGAVFNLTTRAWTIDRSSPLDRRSEFAWTSHNDSLYLWGGESTFVENGPDGEVLADGAVVTASSR